MLSLWLGYQIYEPYLHRMAAQLIRAAAGQETDRTQRPGTALAVELSGEGLPSAYDGRTVGRAPRVKNQGNLGTCWALAATSALEANLLPGESWSFSADHMSMQNGYAGSQNDGGAYTMAMAYLASWTGPVTEEADPYGDGYSPDGLSPVKHVQEMHMIQEATVEEVKKEVYLYGAVQASIYVADGSLDTSPYYSAANASYRYTGEEKANHDILIIGWDDSYQAACFTNPPSQNGAFICQNSWGSRFGENGVFYVSYADARILDTCVSYARIEDTDNYQAVYQSDLCGWVGQIGYGSDTCYFANVYTPAGDETLEAVGFYATDRNTSYEIYAVARFADVSSLVVWEPDAVGSFETAGYYTVDLEEPVSLTGGEPFAVVVKITTPGSSYPVAAEYPADEMTQRVVTEDGEGYISSSGYVWNRTELQYGCNICLKAYTA